jgi:hypothetical protein
LPKGKEFLPAYGAGMRAILGVLLLLVIGGGLVVAGFGQTDSDEVTCGGQVMSPGDICTETSHGSSTDYSYDEEKASGRQSGWVLVGIGGVVLAGGVAAGVGVARGRRRAGQPLS